MINLFYITNNIAEAQIVDKLDVDYIFVDLEKIGKKSRQTGRNTVLSNHSINDVKKLNEVLNSTKILVRCNPIGLHSKKEIEKINNTSNIDMVMLPYFKTLEEVRIFIDLLDTSKVDPALLIETTSSIEYLDDILKIYPFKYVHIGLNDLHIERKTSIMFEPFIDGLLQKVVSTLKQNNQKFGVGGIGKIGSGLVPTPESLLKEHVRLESSGVILSRSFKGKFSEKSIETFESELTDAVFKFREIEKYAKQLDDVQLAENYKIIENDINKVVKKIHDNK